MREGHCCSAVMGSCVRVGLMVVAIVVGRDALAAERATPTGAVEALRQYLAGDATGRPAIGEQAFARVPLTKADAEAARGLLWAEHVKMIRRERAAEVKERKLRDGQLEMPFAYEVFGEKPKDRGRSLFISMHGGGATAKRVNDQQWQNQKRLYKPAEGVYLAPRAPNDAWDMWHQPHIDRLFGRLIEDLIVFEDVDPDRVYVMGYSAGGDGVYQLAPRMADRWAAAAMMAGHPNDASPLGLRNLPFTIHVGGKDAAFKRNEIGAEWGRKLDALRQGDPTGYVHLAKVHPNKPHWMDREDAEAVPWMAQYTRDPLPKRIVWRQDDVTHARFYWLAVPADRATAGDEVRVDLEGQRISVESKGVERLVVRLNDRMVDLDQPVTVVSGKEQLFQGTAARTIGTMARTLAERGDPAGVFSAEVAVKVPAAPREEKK